MTGHHLHDHGLAGPCPEHDSRSRQQGHNHGHNQGTGRGRRWRRHRHHHHDHGTSAAAVLDGAAGTTAGLRAVKISLAGLGVTAVLQLVVAAVSGSVALWADTFHNLADASTALPLWLAFALSRRQPNRRYTYGYGRAEDVAGVVIVAAIALSAAVAAWQSVIRLFDPRDIDHAGWVVLAGVVGFVGNELVAVYRVRIGRRIGSAALVADGLHARVDGLTSLAVVGAALGSLAGWRLADPLIGLAISVVVGRVLLSAARDILRRLMDSVDPEVVDDIGRHLQDSPGIEAVDRVRVRWIGHELHSDAEVVVDGSLDLAEAHTVLEEARHRLLHHVPHLADALIHAGPPGGDGIDPHATTRHHFETEEP